MGLRAWARNLKRDAHALWLAARECLANDREPLDAVSGHDSERQTRGHIDAVIGSPVERDRCPRAGEDAHAGARHGVAGEEAEHARHQLQRDSQPEDARSDDSALLGWDDVQLQHRQSHRGDHEGEEPEGQRVAHRPHDDAALRRSRGGGSGGGGVC